MALLALAWAAYKTPKLKFSQIDGGVWVDVKTGIRYCPNCRTKNILSPLVDANDIHWVCHRKKCGKTYRKKLQYQGEVRL